MEYILETDRLKIRPLNFDDADFIIELLNTEGWLQFIGDRHVHNKTQAIAYIENGPLKSYRENGFGLYVVERKLESKPIGLCGLLKRAILPHPDLGFAFLPDTNGKGYAHEAASQIVEQAKTKLGIDNFLAITLPTNQRSIKLLEKLGFVYTENFIQEDTKEELQLFTLKLKF